MGLDEFVFGQMGVCKFNGSVLRFCGALKSEDQCDVHAWEVEINGRHKKITMPSVKRKEMGMTEVETSVTYLKMTVNGKVLCELDAINNVEKWGGKDRREDIRRAIGIDL